LNPDPACDAVRSRSPTMAGTTGCSVVVWGPAESPPRNRLLVAPTMLRSLVAVLGLVGASRTWESWRLLLPYRRGPLLNAFFVRFRVPHFVLFAACCPDSTSSQYARRQTTESSRDGGPLDEGLLLGVGEEPGGSWVGPDEPLVPAAACPQDCSGHGICDVTVCVCFDGYTGEACESISETQPVPVPVPVPSPSPRPAGARAEEVDGEEQAAADGDQGACPPLTAPGMAGLRCYVRVHPELVPLGIGGGSCLCFVMLLGCAANRGRNRRLGLRSDEGGGYGPTDRNSSLSDASFDDSRSRRRSRSPYGLGA
jgi:hypothetical protein